MAKIKTNRSADKRFSVTGGNKIKRGKASHSHLLSKKTPKHKRRLRHFAIIKTADVKRIKRLIPNAF